MAVQPNSLLDFLFSSRCTFYHVHSSHLIYFLFLFVLFHSCCSHAKMFGKTFAHKDHIFYNDIYRMELATHQTVKLITLCLLEPTHSPRLNRHVPRFNSWALIVSDLIPVYILSFVLFADDTTVYVQHDSIDGVIQIRNSELAKVTAWFDSNKLTLNVKKTSVNAV